MRLVFLGAPLASIAFISAGGFAHFYRESHALIYGGHTFEQMWIYRARCGRPLGGNTDQ